MKLIIAKRRRQSGHMLLLSLAVAGVLGAALASYMAMAGAQNKSVVRSQHWNAALPMAEAGVEDALQLINKYVGGPNVFMITNWPNTASQDQYTLSSGSYYVWRKVDDGWYYSSVINPFSFTPTVRSIGYVLWNDPDRGSSWITREIHVKTRFEPLWSVAMAAVEHIDFAGNNILTDSFDSSDAYYSNPGKIGSYPMGDNSKTKDNGDVVTDLTIINSLSVGNAVIKGRAKTGPEGSVYIGQGSVGSKKWVEGGNTGIEPGWSADDMNVNFESVTNPAGTWLPPTELQMNQTINGKNYQYVFLNSGDYLIGKVTGGVYVQNANVRLFVTDDIQIAGQDEVRMINSTVHLYMSGQTCSVGGNGFINETGLAQNFLYFGLPSNTVINFGGNGTFVGAIYAPQAHFQLNGSGGSSYDFIGASVTRSVKINGNFNFHYDEALRKTGPARGYVPTSWKEM